MQVKAVKITSKGQITLPKQIRERLQTDIVTFEVRDDQVIIRPVEGIGGSLREYARGYKPLKKIRDGVWKEVAREKAGKSR